MTQLTRHLLLALALASSACTSFDRAWQISSPARFKPVGGPLGLPPRTYAQSPFDGRWVGYWQSERHRGLTGKAARGELRLVLNKHDPYKYRAFFRAGWLIFRTDYQVMLDARPRGNTLHLHGEETLSSIFGGAYRYDGTVTPSRFTMRYDSRYDSGTIELRRWGVWAAPR